MTKSDPLGIQTMYHISNIVKVFVQVFLYCWIAIFLSNRAKWKNEILIEATYSTWTTIAGILAVISAAISMFVFLLIVTVGINRFFFFLG